MMDDRELLRIYARDRAEEAFAELIARHLPLVYSAALRQVGGDIHLAQDVTQSVFCDLARKAGALARRDLITGWLHTSTRFAAAKARRSNQRRQMREREAQAMNAIPEEQTAEREWERLAPMLDEVLHELKERDREALLLRYFEGLQLSEVGAKLGLNENTARMRVERALEKLRRLLARRGITSATAALTALLAANASTAAPAGLAGVVSGAVLTAAASATGLSLIFLRIMSMMKLKGMAADVLVAGAVAAPLLLQQQSLARLREENSRLHDTTSQLAQLREENERLAKRTARGDELERLRLAKSEVLRLRGEVNVLRGQARTGTAKPAKAAPATAENNDPPKGTPVITTFQAKARVQIGDRQTLVMIGATGGDGKHLLMFATPSIEGTESDQVNIQTQLIEVPEDVLAGLNLNALNAEGNPREAILSKERLSGLITALKDVKGVNFIGASAISTLGGREATISQTEDKIIGGEKYSLGPVIDLLPEISEDKKSVTLSAGIDYKREGVVGE